MNFCILHESILLTSVPRGSPGSELIPGCRHPPLHVLGTQVTPEDTRQRCRLPIPTRCRWLCWAGPWGGFSCQGCGGAPAPARPLPTGLHPASRCASGVLQLLAKEASHKRGAPDTPLRHAAPGGLTPLETDWHKGLKAQGVRNAASGGIAKSQHRNTAQGGFKVTGGAAGVGCYRYRT